MRALLRELARLLEADLGSPGEPLPPRTEPYTGPRKKRLGSVKRKNWQTAPQDARK